ncbi:MAG: hypothetical protein AB1758_36375, partial [Candidatus Eremiobacterota bacterium]
TPDVTNRPAPAPLTQPAAAPAQQVEVQQQARVQAEVATPGASPQAAAEQGAKALQSNAELNAWWGEVNKPDQKAPDSAPSAESLLSPMSGMDKAVAQVLNAGGAAPAATPTPDTASLAAQVAKEGTAAPGGNAGAAPVGTAPVDLPKGNAPVKEEPKPGAGSGSTTAPEVPKETPKPAETPKETPKDTPKVAVEPHVDTKEVKDARTAEKKEAELASRESQVQHAAARLEERQAQVQAIQNQIAGKQIQLGEIRARVNQLRSTLRDVETERDRLSNEDFLMHYDEVERLEGIGHALRRTLIVEEEVARTTEREIASLTRRVAEEQREIAGAKSELAGEKDQIARERQVLSSRPEKEKLEDTPVASRNEPAAGSASKNESRTLWSLLRQEGDSDDRKETVLDREQEAAQGVESSAHFLSGSSGVVDITPARGTRTEQTTESLHAATWWADSKRQILS